MDLSGADRSRIMTWHRGYYLALGPVVHHGKRPSHLKVSSEMGDFGLGRHGLHFQTRYGWETWESVVYRSKDEI